MSSLNFILFVPEEEAVVEIAEVVEEEELAVNGDVRDTDSSLDTVKVLTLLLVSDSIIGGFLT